MTTHAQHSLGADLRLMQSFLGFWLWNYMMRSCHEMHYVTWCFQTLLQPLISRFSQWVITLCNKYTINVPSVSWISHARSTLQGNNMVNIVSITFCLLHRVVIGQMQLMMKSFPRISQNITSLPFACISDPIRTPVPLKLDVTLPPPPDVRWSISRLYYLFNTQLDRNIAL